MQILSQWLLEVPGSSPSNINTANRLAGVNGTAQQNILQVVLDASLRTTIYSYGSVSQGVITTQVIFSQVLTTVQSVLQNIANQLTLALFDATIQSIVIPGYTWVKMI